MRPAVPALAIVLQLAACGFSGSHAGDPAVDATVVACAAWEPEYIDPCAIVLPSESLDLNMSGTYIYDTDTRTLRDPGGAAILHASEDQAPFVLVSVQGLRVGASATLRAIGVKPLFIVSWSTIRIDGAIDVSSSAGGGLGAGANAADCGAAQVGEDDPGGAGGGGGGGFGAAGGKGGDGDSNQNAGDDGIAIGGTASGASATPTIVRGGCPGADGGQGSPGKRGRGGAGGGAIQLGAAVALVIQGTIAAGGHGGLGMDSDAGGGGGGSGGYVGLDAPTVDATGATIASNGAAGAGGGDDANVGGAGGDGASGAAGAVGGAGGLPGGTSGGTGGSLASPGGATVTAFNTGAGGGGGGGVGFILVWSAAWNATGAVISPAETHVR